MKTQDQSPTNTVSLAGQSPETELAVEGMSCSNCARHVTEAIQSVSGVANATVNLDAGRASVRWNGQAPADLAKVVQAVEAAGYKAKVLDGAAPENGHSHDHGQDRQSGWHWNLWIGLLGTIALMLGEWVFNWGLRPWFRWVEFGVATIVQILAGGRFYQGAWRQLKAARSNMDTLVALGSTTAYAYSVWALFSVWSGHLYFMEAAAIITLVSVGHWLEARASSQASSALRKLLTLAPEIARRRNPDGSETEVPVVQIQPGDLVVLRPGDRIPADGEVIEGASAVDESTLTGEWAPVEKSLRDEVYAGTVNASGRLLARITATGEATALAHIIAAVQRAQTSRANIQRLGDKVSSVFVPVVVAVAAAAGLWWGLAPESAYRAHELLAPYLWPAHPPSGALPAALIAVAAVLIVACPCAMGLATPAAIMAGSNAAAQRGILIRDGVALEKAGRITAVMLDKTGTLTLGRPVVARLEDFAGGKTQEERMKLAAALARHSSHPLSQAVARLSPTEVSFDDWREARGAGVEGKRKREDGRSDVLRLGSFRWLAECGVDLRPGQKFAEEWTEQTATILGLAINQELVAVVAIKDTLKSGAAEVVRTLQAQGLKVFLATGDNRRTALTVARQVGIPEDNVFAEARPEVKAELIQKLQQQGERVAFVGDGINDAPAMQQANLSIAVARASDVAREAADIVLLRSEIEAIPESLGLARATLRTIRQNLFWAFFYNAAGVPLAALGFLSPVLCAAAMGLSDLVVIGNALRLRRWKLH